jgi:beta-xylosidase
VEPGNYTVLSFRIGREHGSLLERMIELGENTELSQEEVDFLWHKSRPDLTKSIIETKNNELHFSLELESHEALLIDFRRNQT